ncbi:hypothetical protein [Rummeliibacillus pycnus]|uniref:hypothetical protein n=1 Tax=Rummeliibacillus pycnus TaxID=101070 RepID=UPI003D29F6BF
MKKYLVAEISKFNKDRIKLKRALYGMQMEDLILHSINAYEGKVEQTTCPHCHEECIVTTKPPFEQTVEVAGKQIEIVVTNYPRNKCNTCGGEFEILGVAGLLDEILVEEVVSSVRSRKPIPNEIDFNELIQLKI